MKKFITLALAMFMIFAQSACRNEQSPQSSREPISTTHSTAPEATDKPAAETGDTDETNLPSGDNETRILVAYFSLPETTDPNNMTRDEDNTGYMQDYQPLTAGERDLLAQVADLIRAKTSIACTGCRYCTTECPKNIAIPDYFDLYNNMKRLNNTSYLENQVVYYANIAQHHGKASDCIGCGLCENNCPQNLPVRELLRDVALEMEG